MIKAVFFDIDGTLVSFKTHAVPPSTIKALKKLRENGIKLFIATGRGLSLIDNVNKSKFDGLLTFNGQYCRTGSGEVIYSNPIAAEDIEAAVEYFKNHDTSAAFVSNTRMYINKVTQTTRQAAALINLHYPSPGDISTAAEEEIFQLLFFGDQASEKELLDIMPSCEATRWTSIFSDIIPRGGGKDVGMRKMLEYYGFRPEECMAFGDGANDISMLRYAGVGVAMGNADVEVKAAADYVTTGVDKNGISRALKHFGLL